MRCPVCGISNEESAAFCYKCGSALRSVDRSAQPATGQTVNLNRTTHVWNEQEPRLPEPPALPSELALEPAPAPYVPALSPQGSYNVSQGRPPQPYLVTLSQAGAQTCNMAVFSLILGILSWTFVPFLAAIGAIITGHLGRREIQASGGRLTGNGLVTTGLILGYLNLGLLILIILALCVLFGWAWV